MVASEGPNPDRFRQALDLDVDPESVLRDVLSRDEFRESSVQSLLDKLIENLLTYVRKILSWIWGSLPNIGEIEGDYQFIWTILGGLVYGLILGLVVASIIVLFRRVILPRLRRLPTEDADRSASDSTPEDLSEPSREQALELARQGRFREALIVAFRFMLTRLHGLGVLKLHPSRTTREILSEMRSQPFKEPLAEIIAHFNAVRYGAAPCTKADFERFLGLCEHVAGGD